MKGVISKFLYNCGLQVQKIKLEDYRGNQNVCPLEILYYTSANKILLSIPVAKCRTQLWHSLEEGKNPFVKTIIQYANGDVGNYKNSKLQEYYTNFIPTSAAEYLKLKDNKKLERLSPLEFVLPWDSKSPEEAYDKRRKITIKENSKYKKMQINLQQGYTEFGPVSEIKKEIEFSRLISIYNKIINEGYKENLHDVDGAIKGYFLVNQEDWCFIITSGKHRAYALSAIGNASIPIVAEISNKSIIDSHKAAYWTHVKSGLFSLETALSLTRKIIGVK